MEQNRRIPARDRKSTGPRASASRTCWRRTRTSANRIATLIVDRETGCRGRERVRLGLTWAFDAIVVHSVFERRLEGQHPTIPAPSLVRARHSGADWSSKRDQKSVCRSLSEGVCRASMASSKREFLVVNSGALGAPKKIGRPWGGPFSNLYGCRAVLLYATVVERNAFGQQRDHPKRLTTAA
jgi:hypothetical protein